MEITAFFFVLPVMYVSQISDKDLLSHIGLGHVFSSHVSLSFSLIHTHMHTLHHINMSGFVIKCNLSVFVQFIETFHFCSCLEP